MKTVKVRTIVEGQVEGEVIISPLPISFLGGIDPKSGKIIDSENPLFGQEITNKIFIFPEGRGSTVGSYVIYGLKINGVAPLAFIANKAETIVAAGAILAEIPMVDRPAEDLFDLLKSGDRVKIDTLKNEIFII